MTVTLDYDTLPRVVSERETLLSFLEWQRETMARKCGGLTDEQLRDRNAAPSTLSLMGLLRHMADVERSWFQRTLNQEQVPIIYSSDADPDGDFDNINDTTGGDALATWRLECERSRAIVEKHPDLDEVVRHRTGREVSMRWILVHTVEEYSRHNGHADLLRERIDGATGY